MKTSIFQIVLLSVFGAFAAAGVLIFALAVGGNDESQVIGKGAIWGTLDQTTFDGVLERMMQVDPSLTGVTYVQKDSVVFDQELTNALAERRGPDMYVVSSDEAMKNEAKVNVTPYEVVSKKQFKDTFVDAANPFLGRGGIVAI